MNPFYRAFLAVWYAQLIADCIRAVPVTRLRDVARVGFAPDIIYDHLYHLRGDSDSV